MFSIHQQFESGNIEVIDASNPETIQLKIRKDSNANFSQWFHFQLLGAKQQTCKMHIINANETSYTNGWQNYRAVASYNAEEWFRVPTTYDGKQLIIEHTPEQDMINYAYFAPYSWDRYRTFLQSIQTAPHCRVSSIGNSLQQRPMYLVTIGDTQDSKLKIWFIARQHCGETMASWFMEGLIERLLDLADPITKSLLDKAVFYLVPLMNPDGTVLGNLRSNAAGIDLNRQWPKPSLDKSPEVYYVHEKMHATGVDFCMDVHGDEAIPYNFFAGCEGNPNFTARSKQLENNFKQLLLNGCPDFQTVHGYARDQFGPENLTMATNYIGYTFDCLSFTLEMPFKDNNNLPDEKFGWSPARCKKLGKTMLLPLYQILGDLR